MIGGKNLALSRTSRSVESRPQSHSARPEEAVRRQPSILSVIVANTLPVWRATYGEQEKRHKAHALTGPQTYSQREFS